MQLSRRMGVIHRHKRDDFVAVDVFRGFARKQLRHRGTEGRRAAPDLTFRGVESRAWKFPCRSRQLLICMSY